MRFRKRPVEIDALRWTGTNVNDIKAFTATAPKPVYLSPGYVLSIPTREGDMRARPGDWIIKGIQGEFYPCGADIFAATYEQVDPPEDRRDHDQHPTQRFEDMSDARSRHKQEVPAREVGEESGHVRSPQAAGQNKVGGGGDLERGLEQNRETRQTSVEEIEDRGA